MSNNEKKILCGDDLLNCDPNDYKNVPLEMAQQSDTIGIATDDNGAYYVYQKGERNAVDWKKPFDSFDSALEYAKSTYSDFLAFLDYLYGKAHAPDNAVSVEAQEDIRNVTDINDYLLKSLKEVENRLDQLLEEQKRTHELLIENRLNNNHITASSLPHVTRRSRPQMRKKHSRNYQKNNKRYSES